MAKARRKVPSCDGGKKGDLVKLKTRKKQAKPVAQKKSLTQKLKDFGHKAAPVLTREGKSLGRSIVRGAKTLNKAREYLRDSPGYRINPMTGKMEYFKGAGKLKQK